MAGLARELLIADDERYMRMTYKALFEAEGYSVTIVRDGAEAVAKFGELRPSLVLLDVMMPNKNGLIACQEIRAIDPIVPILFFTAMPSEVTMVRALGYGADDYIAKDCSNAEFVARVNAAFRRAQIIEQLKNKNSSDICRLSEVVVDFGAKSVSTNGEVMELTKSEVVLLKLLLSQRGRYFSYDDIFSALRGDGYIGDEAAVRMLVSRLKHKLGNDGAAIISKRGHGYKFE